MEKSPKLGRKKLPDSTRRRFTISCRIDKERNSKFMKVPGKTKASKLDRLIESFWTKTK